MHVEKCFMRISPDQALYLAENWRLCQPGDPRPNERPTQSCNYLTYGTLETNYVDCKVNHHQS